MIPRATSTLVSLTEQEASVRKDKSINNDFDYYSVWSRGSSSSYDDLLRDRSSPSVKFQVKRSQRFNGIQNFHFKVKKGEWFQFKPIFYSKERYYLTSLTR